MQVGFLRVSLPFGTHESIDFGRPERSKQRQDRDAMPRQIAPPADVNRVIVDTPRTVAAKKEAEDLKQLLARKRSSLKSPNSQSPKSPKPEGEDGPAWQALAKKKSMTSPQSFPSPSEGGEAKLMSGSMSPDAVEKEIKLRQARSILTSQAYDEKVECLNTYYQARQWDRALESVLGACAVLDGMPPEQLKSREGCMGSRTLETDRAVVKHNLAAVLHQMGHYDAAVHYYAEAKLGMERWTDVSWFGRCCDGQFKAQRLAFVELMMAKAASREKPPPGQYHSEQGEVTEFTDRDFDEAVEKAEKLAKAELEGH